MTRREASPFHPINLSNVCYACVQIFMYIFMWMYVGKMCTSSAVATMAIYLVRHAKRVHPRVCSLIDVVRSMLRRVVAHLAVGSHVSLSLIEDRKTVKPTNNNCFISTKMDKTTRRANKISSCIVMWIRDLSFLKYDFYGNFDM